MDRVAIFVDGAYLDKLLLHEHGGARINLGALAQRLSDGQNLLRSYYYHCPIFKSDPPTPDESAKAAKQDGYFAALSRLPRFQVRLGKLAYRGQTADGRPIFVQKRVDLMLGVDMVQLAATRQINRAVLVAGDSDFVPAIEVVKQHGVLTVLWHGPMRSGSRSNVHRELWDTCDERNELTHDIVTALK